MFILNSLLKTVNDRHNSIFITLSVVYLTLLLAFLPWPRGIGIGLDPFWQWGISRVAQDNLIFGKDIVFTYGPWGYLFDGASIEENFWLILSFRFLVHILFFTFFLIRIISLKNNLRKIIVFLMMISITFLQDITYYPQSIDLKFLFIFISLCTFDCLWDKYRRLMTCFLAIISGFSLLTKFSLGVSILGFLLIYTFVNLYQSIRAKSTEKIKANIISFISIIPISISTAWLLLIPNNFVPSLRKIFTSIIIAGLVSSLFFLAKHYRRNKRKNDQQIINNNLLLSALNSQECFPFLIFYLFYSFIIFLFTTINSQDLRSLLDYLYNSWQVSSGYSSAMSQINYNELLLMTIINLALMISLSFLFIKKDGYLYLNLFLGLLFVIWIGFKHSFVRADLYHVPIIYHQILFMIILFLCKIKKKRYWKIYLNFSLYIIVVSLVILTYFDTSDFKGSDFNNSDGSFFSGLKISLNQISSFSDLQEILKKRNSHTLSKMKISDHFNQIIGNKTVDIVPWDLTLAPANNLNWKPRPIFQSYTAYTTHLDNLNYQSFVNNPRDFIIYSFISIDSRHPFFDEPRTFSFAYCNYIPIEVTNHAFRGVIILLKKLSNNRCLETGIKSTIVSTFDRNEYLENSNNSLIRATINIRYSLWGKFYKTIFRAPPIMLKIKYQDDSEKEYRIVPENANNGVILSHLPRNDKEALSFFSNLDKQYQVKSFSFHNLNNLLYQSDIEILFSSYEVKR